MTTQSITNSVNRSPWRSGFILIPLVLVCFALLPLARAVSPPPDGGYAGANTAEGTYALFNLTTGTNNTALGYAALFVDSSGYDNTATGFRALLNTTGFRNTGTGSGALQNNNTGSENTAHGYQALWTNTGGAGNTANGSQALYHNNGNDNTANGYQALFSNTTGSFNTANGFQALIGNTTGFTNTAVGWKALLSNNGTDNTATGTVALASNTTGFQNTGTGTRALLNNTSGQRNTASGHQALLNNTTGSNNISLGNFAGQNLTTGSNNIDIGNQGVAAEANTIRIGTHGAQTNTYIAGISGTAVTGVAVRVSSSGQLGTAPSSKRFKDAIKPMDKSSEAILALKPVTFRYKHELDPDGIPQFGLVAEDVAKVNPDLVARDAEGKVYTVRYEAVNAMLLNEFLKEHRKVQELEKDLRTTIAQQQKVFQMAMAQQEKEIRALTASLKEQASQIQQVNAQLELTKPAMKKVVNDR